MKREIRVHPNKAELVKAVAEQLVGSFQKAMDKHDGCCVALAGGSTPRDLYALLATDGFRDRIGWQQLKVFWGDERMVPPDHPDSNYRMAREALLDHVPIPPKNIFRVRGEMSPREAAGEYSDVLREHCKGNPPKFDVVLLGLGGDGHTASLFPRTRVFDIEDEPVAAVFVPNLNAWRVTLTLPVLNAAREVMFLVAGKSKAEIVQQVLRSRVATKELPATLVQPRSGKLEWMLDAAAAELLAKTS